MRENAVKREFKIGWIGSVLIILTLLSGTLSVYLMYQEYRIKSEFAEIHTEIANETVSITGGSDGPTSVFLAANPQNNSSPSPLYLSQSGNPMNIAYLGQPCEAVDYLTRNAGKVDQLYCSLPSARSTEIMPIINYCENHLIRFFSVPNVRNYLKRRMYFEMLGNVPVNFFR